MISRSLLKFSDFRSRAGGRIDSHPENPEPSLGLLQWQGAEQIHQPRRSCGVRRIRPSRHFARRRIGRDRGLAAAGRRPVVARHRNCWGPVHPVDQ